MRKQGFTLIELLIVISIIMVLVAFVLINIRGQIARANDAKRKSDLYTLKNALEEYNNDHGAFPPQLSSYLTKVPSDPVTKESYGYFLSASTGGYRVCAILEDKSDPAIGAAGCGGPSGCGLSEGYNYCQASGTTPSAVGTADEGVISTPTPMPTGIVACTSTGACNGGDPTVNLCPTWWIANNCPPGACDILANRCKR